MKLQSIRIRWADCSLILKSMGRIFVDTREIDGKEILYHGFLMWAGNINL